MMLDPKILDEISGKINSALPRGVQSLQQDFQNNIRASLEAAFARLNLVTREEFEVQTAVLMRTRAKVEALEERVRKLENQLQK